MEPLDSANPNASAPGPVLVVGVADFKVSNDPRAQIVTYALGSCLGISFHDDQNRVGGMLHAMLPDSRLHQVKKGREAMFLDTGLELILQAMENAGAQRQNLRCKVFGGAQLLSADRFFQIGAKNIDAFYELSRRLEIEVAVWEVSGRVNRTIRLLNESGLVTVKVPDKAEFVR